MEFVYPRNTETDEDYSALDDDEIAEIIIESREDGLSRIRSELEALAICHDKKAVKRVSGRIDEEIAALNAIDLTKCNSVLQLKVEIQKVASKVVANEWISGLRDKYDVETFDELKEKLTVSEV